MNAGKLGGDNKVTEVYNYLVRRQGEWLDPWDIQMATRTTAVSTRISEVRQEIPDNFRIERKQDGRRHYYRIVHVPFAERSRA